MIDKFDIVPNYVLFFNLTTGEMIYINQGITPLNAIVGGVYSGQYEVK